jgi:curved DNA-binding protein CbpA
MATQKFSSDKLRGSLQDSSLPEILRRIYTERLTGELLAVKDQLRRRIFFETGRAIFAASNRKGDRLGMFLLRRGDINQSVYDLVNSLVPRGRRFGQMLVEMGHISEEQLIRAVQDQILSIIYSLFEWTQGQYEFTPRETTNVPQDLKLELSMADLILEGVGRIRDLASVRRGLGDLNRLIAPTSDPLLRLQQASLKPPEQALLQLVMEPTDVLSILSFSEHPAAVTIRALYGLISAGFLTWVALQEGEDEIALDDVFEKLQQPAANAVVEALSQVPSEAERRASSVIEKLPLLQQAAQRSAQTPPAQPSENITPPMAAPPAPIVPSVGSPPLPVVPIILNPENPLSLDEPKPPPVPSEAVSIPTVVSENPVAKEPVVNERQVREQAWRQEIEKIRPHVFSTNPYEVFSLGRHAELEDFQRAYQDLAQRYHPDNFRHAPADVRREVEEIFRRINTSWDKVQKELFRTPLKVNIRSAEDSSRTQNDFEPPVIRQARLAMASMENALGNAGDPVDAEQLAQLWKTAETCFHAGVRYLVASHYQEAVDLLKKAVHIRPENPEYHSVFALALSANSQRVNSRICREAEQHYLRAIKLAPHAAHHHALLGQLYSRLGMSRRADGMYRQALRIDPTNQIAIKGIAGQAMGVELMLHLLSLA